MMNGLSCSAHQHAAQKVRVCNIFHDFEGGICIRLDVCVAREGSLCTLCHPHLA